jgi:hypothetical protein
MDQNQPDQGHQGKKFLRDVCRVIGHDLHVYIDQQPSRMTMSVEGYCVRCEESHTKYIKYSDLYVNPGKAKEAVISAFGKATVTYI